MRPNIDLIETAFEQMKQRALQNARIDCEARAITNELIDNLDWAIGVLRFHAGNEELNADLLELLESHSS